jgi:hypothetical protein
MPPPMFSFLSPLQAAAADIFAIRYFHFSSRHTLISYAALPQTPRLPDSFRDNSSRQAPLAFRRRFQLSPLADYFRQLITPFRCRRHFAAAATHIDVISFHCIFSFELHILFITPLQLSHFADGRDNITPLLSAFIIDD